VIVTAAELVEAELTRSQRDTLARRATATVAVDWFSSRIEVRFEQPRAAELFRARYASFLTLGHEPAMVCHAVVGDDGLPTFWAEPGTSYRYPIPLRSPEIIAFLLDAIVQRAYFDVNDALMSFHAAAVAVDGSAAAISAISTGGKSTTALACARRGFGLYSDERCVLINGEVHAFPRAINLRKDGIELLASEEIADDGGIGARVGAHAGRDWEAVSFRELFGNIPLPEPRELTAIFFIVGRAPVPHVQELSIGDSITRLIAAGLSGPQAGLPRVAAALALFRSSRAFALTLGTPDETAQVIAATCRSTHELVGLGAR